MCRDRLVINLNECLFNCITSANIINLYKSWNTDFNVIVNEGDKSKELELVIILNVCFLINLKLYECFEYLKKKKSKVK